MTARKRQRPAHRRPAVNRGSEEDGRSESSVRGMGLERPRRGLVEIGAMEGDDSDFSACDGRRRRRSETGHAGLAGRFLIRTTLVVIATVHPGMVRRRHAAGFHRTGRLRHRMRRRRRDQRQSQRGGPNQQQGQQSEQGKSPSGGGCPSPTRDSMIHIKIACLWSVSPGDFRFHRTWPSPPSSCVGAQGPACACRLIPCRPQPRGRGPVRRGRGGSWSSRRPSRGRCS